MTKKQFAQSGKEFRSATYSLTRFMDSMVNKKRKELVKVTEEAAVREYLRSREPAHTAELARLGVTAFELLRPRPPFRNYDPANAQHRKQYARMVGEAHEHDLATARVIYQRELTWQLVPDIAPWEAARQEVQRGWHGWTSDADRRRHWREYFNRRWTDLIAARYPSPSSPTTLPDGYGLPIRCAASDCEEETHTTGTLCRACQRPDLRIESCPNCGEACSALAIKVQGECEPCRASDQEERIARGHPLRVAWARMRTNTLPPALERRPGC